MDDLLEMLYERYNQFGYYEYQVQDPYTLIRILREGNVDKNNLEERIHEYEISERFSGGNGVYNELVEDKNFVQPKSVVIRMFYLELIVKSLPDYFYDRLKISKLEIMQITVAIVMYYMGLNVYKYGEIPVSATVKKNTIGRDDCYFGFKELQMVCGKVSESSYNRYLELFAKDVNEIEEHDSVKLYMHNKTPFILCMTDFLDYIMHEIEKLFKEQYSEQEYSKYMNIKGAAFEELVVCILKQFFEECYHTLYYYPEHKEKVELDIVLRDDVNVAIIECKSGTIWFEKAFDDAAVKGIVKNAVKKAYKSLRKIADYCAKEKSYSFENGEVKVSGINEEPICIHVSMYPLDFIGSNIHTMFPEYIENGTNPILTISFEHLCAILLDMKEHNRTPFEYWKRRKEDIEKYPGVRFDNNELDLYHELMSESRKSMLSQIKELGVLEAMAPNASIMTTFRDESGNEERPASFMLEYLDSVLAANLFAHGKGWIGINKRYLKNMEEIMRVS